MIEGIEEDVEQKLQKDQERKEFKDAGQRIGGSKKERAAYKSLIRLSDLDNLELDAVTAAEMVVKDKVYPKVNAEEEMDKGVESGAAFLKHEIRAAFPAKPRGFEKKYRRAYVGFVEVLVKDLNNCLSLDDIENVFRGYARWKGPELAVITGLVESVTEANREEVEKEFPSFYVRRKFQELIGSNLFYLIFRASKAAQEKWHRAQLYNAHPESKAAEFLSKWNEQYKKEESRYLEKVNAYTIYNAEELAYNKKSWKGVSQELELFRKQAIRFYQAKADKAKSAIDNPPAIQKVREADWGWASKQKKEITKKAEIRINEGLPLSFIKRLGGLEITDVSEHEIMKLFGFRAVEFGNYVKDKEAKQHVKHFLGACADLFEVLGFDPVQVNQMNDLSISFGSRGHGKALATYFPQRKIINLTKSRGDGTVSHEWAHFLDHLIYNRLAGKPTESPLASAHIKSLNESRAKVALSELMDYIHRGDGEPVLFLEKFYPQDQWKYLHLKGETLEESIEKTKRSYPWIFKGRKDARETQKKVFGYLAKAFDKPYIEIEIPYYNITRYYYHSSQLTKYWREPYELFARGFETFIYDKLSALQRGNNYLVSGGFFDHSSKVYPQGKEREHLNHLYENLMNSIKAEFKIRDFAPFTTTRTDEYIEFEEKEDEEVKSGLVIKKEQPVTLQLLEAKLFKITERHAA